MTEPSDAHTAIAFGAGPHRCAGSNLARMNLRAALDVLVTRRHDIALEPGADIDFHSTFNRAPRTFPSHSAPAPAPDGYVRSNAHLAAG
jgi:cytochrome P450